MAQRGGSFKVLMTEQERGMLDELSISYGVSAGGVLRILLRDAYMLMKTGGPGVRANAPGTVDHRSTADDQAREYARARRRSKG